MDNGIIIVFCASVFIMVLLVFLFSFVYKYQKKTISFIKEKEVLQSKFEQVLLESQIEVQENTYRQIANDLHDNVGQLLSTAKMLLALTERKLANTPDELLTANETIAKAITEIRALSKSLDKEWLEQFNFIDNLKTEILRINSGQKVKAELLNEGPIDLPADEQIILFRIVQEAVQNSIKHADPKNLKITAMEKGNEYGITIADDGIGMNDDLGKSGMGMKNMKHRTRLLGGTIAWDSSPKNGTAVTISLPKKNKMV